MTVASLSIAATNISLSLNEAYISEGTNKKLFGMPRGIYLGLCPAVSGGTDLWLNYNDLGAQGDQHFAIVEDRANGRSFSFRNAADPMAVDCSTTLLPIPAGPDVTWYIWLEITYDLVNATVGAIKVSNDSADVPSDSAIMIATATVAGGAAVISGGTTTFSYTTSGYERVYPAPTERRTAGDFVAGDLQFGFLDGNELYRVPSLDEKDAMTNADSPDADHPFMTKINSEGSPSVPVLVWRSHNITSNANVTGQTASVYIATSGLYFIVGGYMDLSSDVVVAPVSSGDITMLRVSGGSSSDGMIHAFIGSASGGPYDPTVASEWDTYVKISSGFIVEGLANFLGQTIFQGVTQLDATSLDLEGDAGATDTVGYIKGQDTSNMRLLFDSNDSDGLSPKIYYGDSELWIVSNAYYDTTNNRWNKGPQNTTDASAICFASGTIRLYSESDVDADWTTGYWSKHDWTRQHRLMVEALDKIGGGPGSTTYAYNCAVSYGDLYEQVVYSIGGRNVDEDLHACISHAGCNFRNRLGGDPAILNITKVETSSSNVSAINFSTSGATKWGFWLRVQSNNIAENAEWYSKGYFHVYI